jgi:hypothetical protein
MPLLWLNGSAWSEREPVCYLRAGPLSEGLCLM